MIDTICLSGGGIKGITYISALEYLEKEKYLSIDKINTFVGTSSGAILGFLLSIGYTLDEMKEFVLNFNFSKLEPDINCNIFLSKYGIDDGIKMMTTIRTFLVEKLQLEDITFQQLYDLKGKTLKIFTTNYTLGRSEIFSHETTPDVSILLAVRMSLSVPFLFTPVEYNDCYYVDGALTYNFGLNYCNPETTLGLAIIQKKINKLDSFHGYFSNLLCITLDSISLNSLRQEEKYKKFNYIEITCQLKDGLKFCIDVEVIKELLEEGETFAKKYFSNFVSKIIVEELVNKTIENYPSK